MRGPGGAHGVSCVGVHKESVMSESGKALSGRVAARFRQTVTKPSRSISLPGRSNRKFRVRFGFFSASVRRKAATASSARLRRLWATPRAK